MSKLNGSGENRDAATLLALLALLVVAACLLLLAAMVIPRVLGILVVVFGFFLFGLFHYIVWGRWMSKLPVDDEDDE